MLGDDPGLLRDVERRELIVSGNHDRPDSDLVQSADRGSCVLADTILHDEEAREIQFRFPDPTSPVQEFLIPELEVLALQDLVDISHSTSQDAKALLGEVLQLLLEVLWKGFRVHELLDGGWTALH